MALVVFGRSEEEFIHCYPIMTTSHPIWEVLRQTSWSPCLWHFEGVCYHSHRAAYALANCSVPLELRICVRW